jgi:lysophospholipase L1-like esterase
MPGYAVLGSSYVRRLGDYVHHDMELSSSCRFFGVGGMRTDSVPLSLLKQIFAFKPDVVAVHLGGNDISVDSSPVAIFERLMDLKKKLHDGGVLEVVFMSICPRGNFTRSPGLTKAGFTRQRGVINRLLGKDSAVSVVRLTMIYPQDYCSDGVHFNDRGLLKYSFRVRGALIWAGSKV